MIKIIFKSSDVIKGLRYAAQDIKSATKATNRQQGQSAKTYARSIAPVKTGNLKQGISYQALSTRLYVKSVVPKSFPYNLWVNEDIKTVMLPTTSDFSKTGPRRARTYASTRHTGTPGYMHHTLIRLNRNYPKQLEKEITRAFTRRGFI